MKAMLIWLVVAVPLAWGVAKSVEKARPLFWFDSLANALAAGLRPAVI